MMLRKILGYFLCFILLTSLGAWFVLHSNYVQDYLKQNVAAFVSETSGYPVNIGSFSFALPNHVIANEVALGNIHDPWANADQIKCTFSFSRLWSRDYRPCGIRISTLDIHHLPQLPVSITPTGNGSAPLGIPIENIVIDSLIVAPAVYRLWHLPPEIFATPIQLVGRFPEASNIYLAFHNAQDAKLSFSGNIDFTPALDIKESNLHISLADLTLLSKLIDKPLEGNLDIDAKISGTIPSLHADIALKSKGIQGFLAPIASTSGIIKCDITPTQIVGEASVASFLNTMPFNIATLFYWKKDNPTALTEVQIKAPHMSIEGSLTFSHSDNWIEGNLSGSHHNIALLQEWLPFHAHGQLNGNIQFHRDAQVSTQIEISSPHLYLDDMHFNNIHLSALASQIFAQPKGDITITCNKLIKNDLSLHHAMLTTSLDSETSNWPFALQLEGLTSKEFFIQSSGEWYAKENFIQATIQALDGQFAHTPFSLQTITTLRATHSSFNLGDTTLSIGSSTLHTSLSRVEEESDINLEVSNFPISLLSLPSPLAGNLSTKVRISGPLHNPQTTIVLNAKDLTYNQPTFEKLPAASMQLTMQLDENGTSIKGSCDLPNYLPLEFDAQLPITASLWPFNLNIDKQSPISGHLKGTTEITSLLHVMVDPPVLSGDIKTALSLAGTLENPEITGHCNITNGTFELLKIGATLHDFSAHIEASNSQLILHSLAGNDDNGGTVTATGHMHLDTARNSPFHVAFDIKKMTLFNQDYAQALFNGQLVMEGDTIAGKLTGDLEAIKADFVIPEQPPALMNTVEVTYINLPKDEAPPQAHLKIPPPSDWPLVMDINLHFPSNLSIKGTDLTSEWKGDIKVQGTTPIAQFFGDVKVAHGQYNFNGKPFTIDQGTITFAGEVEKKTTLYIIASKDLDEVVVDIILKGPIKNPSVSFRSNPPLPQREILSWILFNRGTSEISPFQGSQLSESITNLGSRSKGPDVLTKIRNTLGIDRLDIRKSDSEESQVTVQVGKYISDNILISINKSDVNSLAIEAVLTDQFKLQAEVGDDSQGQLLLKWKRDY